MIESIRLEEGDTMIFNNHRAMHGRESYKVLLALVTSQDPASDCRTHPSDRSNNPELYILA